MANASPLPETNQTPDWPRKVARKVNTQERQIATVEAGVGGFSRAKGRFLYG